MHAKPMRRVLRVLLVMLVAWTLNGCAGTTTRQFVEPVTTDQWDSGEYDWVWRDERNEAEVRASKKLHDSESVMLGPRPYRGEVRVLGTHGVSVVVRSPMFEDGTQVGEIGLLTVTGGPDVPIHAGVPFELDPAEVDAKVPRWWFSLRATARPPGEAPQVGDEVLYTFTIQGPGGAAVCVYHFVVVERTVSESDGFFDVLPWYLWPVWVPMAPVGLVAILLGVGR